MTTWGYARVSTLHQDPSPQLEALRQAGVSGEHLVVERMSGATKDRPGLAGLLEQARPGDVLVIWKLDRLGRSLTNLIDLVTELGAREIQLKSLTDNIDTTTASGRLLFHVMAAVAEFEREMVRERTANALAEARRQNKLVGRPSRVSAEQYRHIHAMAKAGADYRTIAATVGLSRAVVGRVVRKEIASLEAKFGRSKDSELPRWQAPQGGGR